MPLTPTLPRRSALALLGGLLAATACSPATTATTGSADATGDQGATQGATLTLTDHFDREVEVPLSPGRVAVLEWEGLITKTLAILGEDSTIVAVDPATKKDPTRQVLVPALADATEVGSAWSGINYESLASLEVDLVLMEAWVASNEDRELHEDAVRAIEGLGIPVVVFLSPSNVEVPSLDAAYAIVDTVGQVYDRSADTDRVVSTLRDGVAEVLDRIPTDLATSPTVALFATTTYVMGTRSVQSALFADLLGATNVAGPGTFVEISEEKLLALDPDVLVVIGHEGYLGVEEITSGATVGLDWSKVQSLRALQTGRVVALGYDEWRATLETPVALLKVASVVHPEQFAGVDLEAQEQQFYREVFDLDDARAAAAIEGQRHRGELDG